MDETRTFLPQEARLDGPINGVQHEQVTGLKKGISKWGREGGFKENALRERARLKPRGEEMETTNVRVRRNRPRSIGGKRKRPEKRMLVEDETPKKGKSTVG